MQVQKYRKKPIVIEAIHLTEKTAPTPREAAEWCGGKVIDEHYVGEKVHIVITTLEGDMKAEYGDYIIKGIAGEFYPCKPDIFEATYEKVEA